MLAASHFVSSSAQWIIMQSIRKVRINWQSDEGLVQKVWRCNTSNIDFYCREQVEQELLRLFPLLKYRGLRLELSYEDSQIGKVTIDGDADMKAALIAFSEEENLSFRTLIVAECIKPDIEAQQTRARDFNAPHAPAKKRKVSAFIHVLLK